MKCGLHSKVDVTGFGVNLHVGVLLLSCLWACTTTSYDSLHVQDTIKDILLQGGNYHKWWQNKGIDVKLFTAGDEQLCSTVTIELGFPKRQKHRLKIIMLENIKKPGAWDM